MIIQKFTGSINARILNPINSNENYRVHRLDMNKALNLEVKLETDDPSAFMFLGVFTKESTINNVNSDFFSSISSLINVNDQRGFLFGQGNLSGFISKDSFDPDDYIFQVINVQSQKNINYTLTISYEQGKCSSSEINPYLGFWAVSDRNFGRLSYEIKQRSDGSLYLKFYLGDNYNGFSKVSINGVTLTKTKKGYRRYFGIRFYETEY
jgi:hypothetical protein